MSDNRCRNEKKSGRDSQKKWLSNYRKNIVIYI